jgi:hypothetical protein
MGNLLIALGTLVVAIFIFYLCNDKDVQEEYSHNDENAWSYWWNGWLDNDEKAIFIALAVAIFLASWGITTAVTRAIVKEKYTIQKESTVTSYGGTGYGTFTIGRYGSQHDGYYYVYENTNEGLKELKLYSGSVDVLPNSFDDGISNTATLITESTMKKIKRSKMPFMFLSSKDIVKEVGNCGCSGGKKYILKVPSKYLFVDKFKENGR